MAPAKVAMSNGGTPTSGPRMAVAAGSAPGRPAVVPTTAGRRPSRAISRTTSAVVAPRAIRSPISRVRRATPWATTPHTPMAASSGAMLVAPNKPRATYSPAGGAGVLTICQANARYSSDAARVGLELPGYKQAQRRVRSDRREPTRHAGELRRPRSLSGDRSRRESRTERSQPALAAPRAGRPTRSRARHPRLSRRDRCRRFPSASAGTGRRGTA
jgi:hypothetical protein